MLYIPTLQEFLYKAYHDTPEEKRPERYKEWIQWFLDTEEQYNRLFVYDDGK